MAASSLKDIESKIVYRRSNEDKAGNNATELEQCVSHLNGGFDQITCTIYSQKKKKNTCGRFGLLLSPWSDRIGADSIGTYAVHGSVLSRNNHRVRGSAQVQQQHATQPSRVRYVRAKQTRGVRVPGTIVQRAPTPRERRVRGDGRGVFAAPLDFVKVFFFF